MQKQILLGILLSFISFTVACGDAEPVSSACGPVPEEELEDCVIDVDPQFTTPEDLQALCETRCKRIDGPIIIGTLEGVTDLRAFENVREARSVSVDFTKDLKTLDGIENIEWSDPAIGVRIRSNAELRSIEALNAPSSPAGINIRSNPKLESLRGLENVVEAGEVTIDKNDSLQNFEGLGNLERTELLSFIDNEGLTSGAGLDSVTAVSRSFNIIGSPNLVDLSNTLPAAESIEQVVLEDNTSLRECEVEEFLSRIEPADTIIGGNGPACE